jgi:hypothetical protein
MTRVPVVAPLKFDCGHARHEPTDGPLVRRKRTVGLSTGQSG